jgi:ferredoxin
MTVKVVIDPDACVLCGICYNDECPDVFEEGEASTELKEEFQTNGPFEGEVPDNLESCVKNAEDSCPTEAIHIK